MGIDIDNLPGNARFTSRDGLIKIPPFVVPGIVTGAAYAANDQFGALMMINVPVAGVILSVLFHDLDDEGLAKELWVFHAPPSPANDNAAFTVSDTELLTVECQPMTLNVNYDVNSTASTGFLITTGDTPVWFSAPQGKLWLLLKTLGTDNIAAGSLPRLSLVIKDDSPTPVAG